MAGSSGSVLDLKDAANDLETVRFYTAGDPVYFSIDNRPLCDIEQRTVDLNRIFTPARGLRVRQERPAATANIEVEPGVIVTGGTTVTQYAGQTIAIPATGGGGLNRVDLIWYDPTTQLANRAAGAEQAVAFSSLVRPALPSQEGIPLSYVYVDNTPTVFDEKNAINTAGAIQDVRPAIGHRREFEETPSNLLEDIAGGAVGTSALVAHADHQHPPHVDNTNPIQLQAGASAAPGTGTIYSRLDHVHGLLMEANPLNHGADIAGGLIGTSGALARGDHRHVLNVPTSGLPTQITPASVRTQGVAATYSRSDHQHSLSGFMVGRVLYGAVTITGTIANAGSGGWTVVRNSNGDFTVTFTVAFSTAPAVSLTALKSGANVRGAQVVSIGTTILNLETYSGTANIIDAAFHFIAMAP